MDLYRFISFEDFINLTINHKLRFTRPFSWDDKYEAYFMMCMEHKEGILRTVKSLYKEVSPQNPYATADNFFKIWNSRWNSLAQCWTSHAETDAMWRIYAYGNHAVRIRSSYEKVKRYAEKTLSIQEYDVMLKEVTYDVDLEDDMIRKQTGQMKSNLDSRESFFHKRKVFEHEAEYRLLITKKYGNFEALESQGVKRHLKDKLKGKSDDEIIQILADEIENHMAPRNEKTWCPNELIEIKNIQDLVDGIMVHPKAESWFAEQIEEICCRENVPYDGQSVLYGSEK